VGDEHAAHRRHSDDYIFAQVFDDICHVPPAFSHSLCVVYCEKSPDVEPELGDGLADGEAPEPLGEVELLPVELLPEAPELVPPPVAPEPVAPDVPDGPPAPELLPAAPLPLPEPAAWAMTSAGVSNMIETSRRARKCFM